ncbi:MAG: hypothetical protein SF182_07215, partial [Deltaproteobacteria bacterium]|nr:hypothetical protein [Deltaproteobacteria bacterium]
RIVTGVDEDCPGCSGEEKARAARIEIAQALQNRNGRTPSLRDVNVLLELAVQTATQRAPATAPNQ